jgi:hypothetical protein
MSNAKDMTAHAMAIQALLGAAAAPGLVVFPGSPLGLGGATASRGYRSGRGS